MEKNELKTIIDKLMKILDEINHNIEEFKKTRIEMRKKYPGLFQSPSDTPQSKNQDGD